ncbi:MAG: hypothetical protein NTZ05_07815 [Chloroflexi bacterium]|nr:hypothetical protein [Chloroflexota bacterium]
MLISSETARGLLDTLAALLLGTALVGVLVRRIDYALALLATQGALLTGAAAVTALETGTLHGYLAAAATAAVKAVGIPLVLHLALREVRLKREVAIAVSSRTAVPIAVGLTLLAYDVAGRLGPVDQYGTRHALPAAMAMLLIGLFTMLVRKKALSQVISLVSMENGVYLAAVTVTHGLPLAVEIGIALDLFMSALVTGMVVREISRTFKTIDTDRMRMLWG